jgi:hypothetical protein
MVHTEKTSCTQPYESVKWDYILEFRWPHKDRLMKLKAQQTQEIGHLRMQFSFIVRVLDAAIEIIYLQKTVFISYRQFCYVIFNSHMFNAPRFNFEKDVSLQKILL